MYSSKHSTYASIRVSLLLPSVFLVKTKLLILKANRCTHSAYSIFPLCWRDITVRIRRTAVSLHSKGIRQYETAYSGFPSLWRHICIHLPRTVNSLHPSSFSITRADKNRQPEGKSLYALRVQHNCWRMKTYRCIYASLQRFPSALLVQTKNPILKANRCTHSACSIIPWGWRYIAVRIRRTVVSLHPEGIML